MPYEIRRTGARYQVVNAETGEAKSKPTTKTKAERQLKLLNGIEHGWTPAGKDSYTRTVKGKRVRMTVKGGSVGSKRRGKAATGVAEEEGKRT